MPLENLYVDYQIVARDKKEITVLTCAVPKMFIDTLVEILDQVYPEFSEAIHPPDVDANALPYSVLTRHRICSSIL